MVAEPTLFLTKDREVQVRAYTTKRGKEVFCVKDFIRQTAGKSMGPNDAMVYWLSSLAQLMHEEFILEQYMVKFPGPYEKPNVCLRAEGLLVLYGHLCMRFDWVNKKYEAEVHATLFDIVQSKSAAAHVEMYDDGEVDALLAERGDRDLECPPAGSEFNYVNQEEAARQKAFEEDKERAMKDLIAQLEAKSVALEAKSQALDEANAKLGLVEAEKEVKRRKQTGFTIGDVLKAQGLAVEAKELFSKKLIAKFKALHPDRSTFKKHDTLCFFAEDRPIVEGLIRVEYELMLVDEGRLDE